MYTNKYNNFNYDQDGVLKNQQFPTRPPSGPPGRPPSGPPSGPPGRPPSGPPSGPPREGRPMTGPPNFTPELPSNVNQFTAPGEIGEFRGGGPQVGERGFRRCLHRFTYIWLFNGNNFWFYPIFAGRRHVEGFRWSRNNWVYDRIDTRRILFFRCF